MARADAAIPLMAAQRLHVRDIVILSLNSKTILRFPAYFIKRNQSKAQVWRKCSFV
jgi:hypothetical protein